MVQTKRQKRHQKRASLYGKSWEEKQAISVAKDTGDYTGSNASGEETIQRCQQEGKVDKRKNTKHDEDS